MDLESTITLVGFAAFAVALFGYLATMKRDLRAEMVAIAQGLEARTDARFTATDRRLDDVVARFDARFDASDTRFDRLESKFDGLENRFDRLENRFDRFEERFDALDRRVSDLRDDVRAGFAATDLRLTTLEQRTFDIGARRRPGAG